MINLSKENLRWIDDNSSPNQSSSKLLTTISDTLVCIVYQWSNEWRAYYSHACHYCDKKLGEKNCHSLEQAKEMAVHLLERYCENQIEALNKEAKQYENFKERLSCVDPSR